MVPHADQLVDRYRSLTSFLVITAIIGWWVVAARLDGPRSLNNTWAVWLAVACLSTVASGATAVLAGIWAAAAQPAAEVDADPGT